MATFRLSGPDGAEYEIDAPDEGAALQAFQGMQGGASPPPAAPQPPSAAEDVAKSVGTGVAKGALGLAGTVGSLYDGLNWVANKGYEGAKQLGAKGLQSLGYDVQYKPMPDNVRAMAEAPSSISGPALQKDVERVAGPFRKPQTEAGKSAETIAEFLPSAALGPGSMGRKLLAYGLLPGAGADVAGRVAAGTLGESARPWGQLAGGVAGGILGHSVAGVRAPEAVLSGSTRGITDADLDAAARRMADAPIRLGPAEAVAAQVDGRTSLNDLQRVLENSHETAPAFQQFYRDRPQQIDQAGRAVFGQIAPDTRAPSMIGRQAQAEANDALTAVNQSINAREAPFYSAANTRAVDPQALQFITQDPAFQQALNTVRGDAIRNNAVANFGVDQVPTLIAVRQQMARMEQAAMQPGPGLAPDRQLAMSITPVRERLDQIITQAAPSYGQALGVGAGLRQTELEPLRAGPIGQIARTDNVPAQAQALYPSNPLVGAQHETADAVRRLPETAGPLTRQHLERAFNEATQRLQSGANQFGGARYAAEIAGNPQQAEVLRAGVGALPNGPQVGPDLQRALDAFSATGYRQAPGSQTSFNTALRERLEAGSLLPDAIAAAAGAATGKPLTQAAGGAKFAQGVKEAIGRHTRESNMEALARALTADSLQPIMEARRRIPPHLYNSYLVQALAARAALANSHRVPRED